MAALIFWINFDVLSSIMEPHYNEVPRDWQNMFAIDIEVSLYRGLFPHILLLLK